MGYMVVPEKMCLLEPVDVTLFGDKVSEGVIRDPEMGLP